MVMSEDVPEHIPTPAEDAALELSRLDERTLQDDVVEPLLRSLGYENVRSTAGPTEHGRDLVATKRDEWGKTKLIAIQIKKAKISAKAGDTTSYGLLLNQLLQSVQEPAWDPTTNTMRPPDECIFITPFPIPGRAREAFLGRSQQIGLRHITVVDGVMLVELAQQRLPGILAKLDMEVRVVPARQRSSVASRN